MPSPRLTILGLDQPIGSVVKHFHVSRFGQRNIGDTTDAILQTLNLIFCKLLTTW